MVLVDLDHSTLDGTVVFLGWNTQLSVMLPSATHAEYFLLEQGDLTVHLPRLGSEIGNMLWVNMVLFLHMIDVLLTSKQWLAGMITLPT